MYYTSRIIIVVIIGGIDTRYNGDREMFIFLVQLTASGIGNLTQLIFTLAIYVTIHTYTRLHGYAILEDAPPSYSVY